MTVAGTQPPAVADNGVLVWQLGTLLPRRRSI